METDWNLSRFGQDDRVEKPTVWDEVKTLRREKKFYL